MAFNENHSDMTASGSTRQSLAVLHPLHEAALRIADLGLNRSRAKTRDLVNLLLCHGARAWRGNQPPATMHLHVAGRDGRSPVYMRIR